MKNFEVLVTGSNGFIGKNLCQILKENKYKYSTFTRNDSLKDLEKKIINSRYIFHLAGVNKPELEENFNTDNINLTQFISDVIKTSNKKITLIFASSTQAILDNTYGLSKRKCEKILKSLNTHIIIFRLNGIFGKWSRPNYNSVVSTFCNNLITGKKNHIDGPNKILSLTYIDDLIRDFLKCFKLEYENKLIYLNPSIIHRIKVKNLDKILSEININRKIIYPRNFAIGITRKLYATYLSFLPKNEFSYCLKPIIDHRGKFVEISKIKDSVQISYITINPLSQRGGHYHHTKSEKFIVLEGTVRFHFKHISTNKSFDIIIEPHSDLVVESIPGWYHEIINDKEYQATILVLASENFDKNKPDTFLT